MRIWRVGCDVEVYAIVARPALLCMVYARRDIKFAWNDGSRVGWSNHRAQLSCRWQSAAGLSARTSMSASSMTTPPALRRLTRDGWLLVATRFIRLFAYGSLSVVLVFYLFAGISALLASRLATRFGLIRTMVATLWSTCRSSSPAHWKSLTTCCFTKNSSPFNRRRRYSDEED